MLLTQEQIAILNSSGNIKINAVAGSGKTTTIIEYARTRPAKSKILYLAFNRSVKLEAAQKFAARGLTNVTVETAHSLAYKHIVFKYGLKVKGQGYTTSEIVEMLKLRGNGEKHNEYIIANHINKLIACYCNSDKNNIRDLNYLDSISDPKAKAFAHSFYNYIEKKAALLLHKMDKGEIGVTHDLYLKKFQLSRPQLNFDYILFDEGQDASPAMLDIFLNQAATKVIVGDVNQQIYGWRYAVNSLGKAGFTPYTLSSSFRFGADIARLAVEVLKFKKIIGREENIEITGRGIGNDLKIKAVLARTNLGLFLEVIEYVSEKKIQHLYFEGTIHSYTYADEGASLYDVLNLHNGKHHLVNDKLIRSMQDLGELEEYIEKTADPQLGMLVEIVKKYGNRLPGIIRSIKEKHVTNEDKHKAEMIFSTVHRSKGMEYDAIQLVNDFITEKALQKHKDQGPTDKLNEEINLLYVAITRAKSSIHIPEGLLPPGFPVSERIHVMKAELTENSANRAAVKPKTYAVEEVRKKHKVAYAPWSEEADHELATLLCEGLKPSEIATHFGRTEGAILSRIRKIM